MKEALVHHVDLVVLLDDAAGGRGVPRVKASKAARSIEDAPPARQESVRSVTAARKALDL